VTYDNNRVLHGRKPFDPSSGERHLQGCYMNMEDLDSALRLLGTERASRWVLDSPAHTSVGYMPHS
jgi:gamma-butyrobetaine dioxygenase